MTCTPQLYYKQNRLKQLRAFCRAAQIGSISEAAESLCLSQPTISLQIQALEREMGIVVFERRGPRIKLTPEGQVLFQLAQPLVEGIDNLEAALVAHAGNLDSGELNIAAGESTILYILPGPMQRFAQKYPGIHLKLHNVTGRDGMAMLRADEADFAVGSMIEVPDDIVYQPSMVYHPALIAPLDHPLGLLETVTLEDIAQYGLILPPRHLATWRIVEMGFASRNLRLKVALEAGGWEIIKKYVELGMGISIVTDVCLNGTERVIRRHLLDYFPTRSYGIVIRKGKYLSPQAKRFIDMMDPAFL
ncbi:MAG: LysR family transcriptional regulator [Gammaproteobacteria bacterium]|nr:LysR family transcriptional regulator [Gammaproteobacteria bacterium]MBU1656015.1 LysR family transcriptional regulator [Gammaproteobacteria bacterium]MBU1962223.1 LysR family transcriptional regulator [Gammaproteobacteria bacterium]